MVQGILRASALALATSMFSQFAYAQNAVDLTVAKEKKGRTVIFTITPAMPAAGCSYTLLGARKSTQLAQGKGTLLAVIPGDAGTVTKIATKLKRLKLEGKPKRRFFFQTTLTCGDATSESELAELVLTESPKGTIGPKKWLKQLQAKLANTNVTLQNAFPALSFSLPVDLEHADDGTDRLFVAEQGGRIWVFENSSTTSDRTLFLDLSDLTDAEGERGLFSIAFHPNYETDGFFFVHYTNLNGDTRVVRYRVSDSDPNVADPNSALTILAQDQPFGNHNGGEIAFGPDGFLYIALGDGGSGGDPQNNGQRLDTLLGKILRININSSANGENYAIPASNPFVGDAGARGEIFAYGLRNPWKISFDPPTARLWAGDVGQDDVEEVDIIESGKNYGWKIMEGADCFPPGSNCDQTGLTLPVAEYSHALGQSVTGGYVYRGPTNPGLTGAYIYGDFSSGRIWSVRVNPTIVQELMNSELTISSFGIDQANELYVVDYSGAIYKFVP